ncbi:hypothetical protein ACIBAI_05945 [Streptomyces sp. NPDC051041]|uniref:hypothetical protein n=1 Tax=Streptomyces sp. NPDC051041 TaxID=3365640 RepID=UPI00378D253C
MLKDCDFCNLAGTARWQYVLPEERPVVGLANEDGHVIVLDDDGLWNACIGCSLIVDRGDVAGLIQRVERHLAPAFPDMFGPQAGETWKAMMTVRYAAVMLPGTQKRRI